jgi:hypothetical protein
MISPAPPGMIASGGDGLTPVAAGWPGLSPRNPGKPAQSDPLLRDTQDQSPTESIALLRKTVRVTRFIDDGVASPVELPIPNRSLVYKGFSADGLAWNRTCEAAERGFEDSTPATLPFVLTPDLLRGIGYS